MNPRRPKTHTIASWLLAASIIVPAHAAGPKGDTQNPDFTKGDTIPEGATHDWTLGATGARGWIYSNRLETSEARQIAVTTVDRKSPADGVLEVGDVILGVSGKPFSYDPRTEFGKALTLAESEAGKGELSLIRWRDGKEENVTVELPVLGTYSATAPFDCPKSARILEQGCEALAERIKDSDYQANPITRSLNALALLASGERKYRSLLKKEAKWASEYSNDSMATWYYGYVIAFLAEYHMATGDRSVVDGLRRLALEAATGQSIVGSWGHKFAGDDGRLVGYGMMNAPGVPLTTSLVLAREAGVKTPEIDLAIERSAKLLRFYAGKGSIPYGDHAPWIQTHDDNGKNGMAAVLFSLTEEPEKAEYFSRMSLASHGNERDTGHTGNFWNMTWAIPGVVQSGPHATGAWMEEFGAWYFDFARRWDGTYIHQGPPEPKGDHTRGWDATGAYLLAYAMPLKKILLTGKKPSAVPQLDADEAKAVVIAGRGWTNNNRNEAYDQLSGDQLFASLESWSPVVRERAAMALARRKSDVPVRALVRMLKSGELHARYGACTALAQLGGAAAPAVRDLRKTLRHEDLWLRIQAAEALAAIGEPGMEALPELLKMIAKEPTPSDPRGMEQRYVSIAVFGGMLKRTPLADLDRDLLRTAVSAGLENEDGRARSAVGAIYDKLSFEEIKPLLPAILKSVVEPSPSGIMFADGIRIDGLRVLSSHRIEEGMQACAGYIRNQNPWASEKRTPEILKILHTYGAHAESVIPELKQAAAFFGAGEEGFPNHLSLQKEADILEAIRKIKASEDRPELVSISEIKLK